MSSTKIKERLILEQKMSLSIPILAGRTSQTGVKEKWGSEMKRRKWD